MKSYMVIDGQWGSTGKGLLNGYLAHMKSPDAVVCNFGPNAGHTVIHNFMPKAGDGIGTDPVNEASAIVGGRKCITCQIPTAALFPSVRKIYIGPGSIIDPDLFDLEMAEYGDLLRGKSIFIHPNAAMVTGAHKKQEKKQVECISSTCKGTGAAQVDLIMRNPRSTAAHFYHHLGWLKDYERVFVNYESYMVNLMASRLLHIESAQGFELSVDRQFYPYCTSRPINVWHVLSDCGIPCITTYGLTMPKVYVTMRTFPIRVGHAFNGEGEKVGDSGPVYPDQKELDFKTLGVKDERTTVTNKVRRIFTWSWDNFRAMYMHLNPSHIFLNFVNYLEDNPRFDGGQTGGLIHQMEREARKLDGRLGRGFTPRLVRWIGTGPSTDDVIERPWVEVPE